MFPLPVKRVSDMGMDKPSVSAELGAVGLEALVPSVASALPPSPPAPPDTPVPPAQGALQPRDGASAASQSTGGDAELGRLQVPSLQLRADQKPARLPQFPHQILKSQGPAGQRSSRRAKRCNGNDAGGRGGGMHWLKFEPADKPQGGNGMVW